MDKKNMLGVGLRPQHYPHLELHTETKVDWFEAISENYMNTEGRPLSMLLKVRQDYPVALHGVGLSVASDDGVSDQYLGKLKKLIDRVDPLIVSDHFCWSSLGGHYSHDLLPFPFNSESLDRICQNVEKTQELLKRQICLENISYYLTSKIDELTEPEFINEVCKRTGCGVLFDLNNIYVNSINHQFDPFSFIKALNADNVKQLHLAGPSQEDGFVFDTHSAIVPDIVWKLFEFFNQKKQAVPVIIEWDENIPEFSTLEIEVEKARRCILTSDEANL